MAQTGRRRALGQHFLRDQKVACDIADAIIREAQELRCTHLLEIGPGKGAITTPILARLGQGFERFIIVEKDKKLAEEWSDTFLVKPESIAHVVSGDFLEIPEKTWLSDSPLAVVSNLPYSAGTAILDRLARHPQKIPVMVLMFQAEVAQRIRAQEGEKARGSLSVWVQNCWDVEKFLFVPPRAFSPPPEVDSEVIILRARKEPRIAGTTGVEGADLWERLLKLTFSQRRQMLRRVLRVAGPWRNALELSGIDGTKRAEALNWNEWNQLFQALKQ